MDKHEMTECCICHQQFTGKGESPYPVALKDLRCCEQCFQSIVCPAIAKSVDPDKIQQAISYWSRSAIGAREDTGPFLAIVDQDSGFKHVKLLAQGLRFETCWLCVDGILDFGYSSMPSTFSLYRVKSMRKLKEKGWPNGCSRLKFKNYANAANKIYALLNSGVRLWISGEIYTKDSEEMAEFLLDIASLGGKIEEDICATT